MPFHVGAVLAPVKDVSAVSVDNPIKITMVLAVPAKADKDVAITINLTINIQGGTASVNVDAPTTPTTTTTTEETDLREPYPAVVIEAANLVPIVSFPADISDLNAGFGGDAELDNREPPMPLAPAGIISSNQPTVQLKKNRIRMTSVVLKTLSVILGLFFVFVGVMKVAPYISRELHKDLRKDYVKYAKVFPLAQTLVFKVSPKWYRRTVGGLEILCGLILTLIPYAKAKQVANVILIILMIGAVYSHYMVDDRFERMAPALVFFFMLTCRLVVDWQLSREIALKAPIVEAKSEKTE
nr:EOG090X0IKQ [Lepidurus arcticus]